MADFCKDYLFAGFYNQQATVWYLNPANDLRKIDSIGQFKTYPFDERDKPIVALILFWTSKAENRYCLRWAGDRRWRIVEFGDTGNIIVEDIAGQQVSIDTPLEDFKDRMEKLLRFVTTYSSVSDYTLKVVSAYSVPLLRGTKSQCGSPDLAKVRIAIQLGVKGTLFDREYEEFEGQVILKDLLERDPDRS